MTRRSDLVAFPHANGFGLPQAPRAPFSMFKGHAAGFTIAPPPWISPNARRRAICSGCLSDWINNRQGRIFAEKRCERCLKNAFRGALRCLEGGCLSTFNLWVPCQSWSWARNKKSLRASRGVPKNKICGAKWCFLVPGGCLSSPTNNHPKSRGVALWGKSKGAAH